MENVTVNKETLLEELRRNREEHQQIFEEACEGYKTECINQLEEHLENVRSGKVFRVVVSLPTPEEHTKDYDRAIKMLEMSVQDEIVIDEYSFQCYVMDDWQWKRAFLTSNAGYSATAGTSLSKLS